MSELEDGPRQVSGPDPAVTEEERERRRGVMRAAAARTAMRIRIRRAADDMAEIRARVRGADKDPVRPH